MNSIPLQTELYQEQTALLPKLGQQIIGQYNQDEIVVYQAFNKSIARDAVELQKFGGNHYSFNRMSWIKPNFLWMMFRSGWGRKANQEHILAIKVKLEGFFNILSEAVHSSYTSAIYHSRDNWQAALSSSEVRLQWDPDHDPYGNKVERRAIQLGLKGHMLQQFSESWTTEIVDITEYVKAEKSKLDQEGVENLQVPVERVLEIHEQSLITSIGIKK